MFREKAQARIAPVSGQMQQAMETMAPDGRMKCGNTQPLDLASLGTIFPFIEPVLVEPGGTHIGFSKSTDGPVIYDRFSHSGYVILVSGKIGAGKSFVTKILQLRRYFKEPDTDITILDPRGGFSDFVNAVGGQSIDIDRETVINPLEIRKADAEDSINEYQRKISTALGIISTVFDEKGGLTTAMEGVLRRAIKLAYLSKGITEDPATHGNESPTIGDVIDIVHAMSKGQSIDEFLDIPSEVQDELDQYTDDEQMRETFADEAKRVVLGLEAFRDGGQYANLNGQTTVDLQDQVAQFNLEPISSASGDDDIIYMHLVLDWMLQRVRSSDGKQIVTIDEAHELMGYKSAQKTLNAFVRQSRHWNVGLNLVSQTIDEWLGEGDEEANYSPRDIYKQCDAKLLMYHGDLDEREVEGLDLTSKEVDFINKATQGDKDGNDHSEALVCTDNAKVRTRVYASPYELHVLDQDLDARAFLVGVGMAPISDLDTKEDRQRVREILSQEDPDEISIDNDEIDLWRPSGYSKNKLSSD